MQNCPVHAGMHPHHAVAQVMACLAGSNRPLCHLNSNLTRPGVCNSPFRVNQLVPHSNQPCAPLFLQVCADNRGSRTALHQNASHATPQTTATAGPQAPWVVHFSQMPDDSVYGAQQQQESPSAVHQLAQQLHLRLSPISEAFSQEQGSTAQKQPSPDWRNAGASMKCIDLHLNQQDPVMQVPA